MTEETPMIASRHRSAPVWRGLLVCAALVLSGMPAVSAAGDAPETAISRIAFGSCANQNKPQPVWRQVMAREPQLMLMLGDNVYADTTDMAVMARCYEKLGKEPGFAALREHATVLGIWDDHDFGANDAGAGYPQKEAARRLMLDFFGEPMDSPRRSRPDGAYGSWIFGPEGRRVQIILLDLRWNRSPLKHVSQEEYARTREPARMGPYLPDDAESATLLGEAQWRWLEAQLREPAELRLIGSSIQCLAEFTGWEAWANFPRERRRLFELLARTRANGVIVLSGDTHWAELSSVGPKEGVPYPLWEITSSGLTEVWPAISPNRHRVGEAFAMANFGLVEIDWERDDPAVTLSIISAIGETLLQQHLLLSQLSAVKTPQGKTGKEQI